MTTATAIAHPNIALVKYWGKRNLALNLPSVSSLSLTLGPWRTQTQVTWGSDRDRVSLDGTCIEGSAAAKVLAQLDRIDPSRPPCSVVSDNDFPTGAGLASSASGFAALTLAACAAAGQERSLIELSVLARQGSGSACRSLWGGFVEWDRGEQPDGTDSHGAPIADQHHWDVSMVVAVVHDGPKSVGSTEGMLRTAQTSPLYQTWLDTAEANVRTAHDAVLMRDIQVLGEVMESSTFKMHATMHTASPPLIYWQPGTVAAIQTVFELRQRGVGAWVTMDAGPQVKVLCLSTDADEVQQALQPHAQRVEVLRAGGPATVRVHAD